MTSTAAWPCLRCGADTRSRDEVIVTAEGDLVCLACGSAGAQDTAMSNTTTTYPHGRTEGPSAEDRVSKVFARQRPRLTATEGYLHGAAPKETRASWIWEFEAA